MAEKNLFNLTPTINEKIRTETEGTLSVLAFPRFGNKFMQKYFVPKNKSATIRVRLDEYGTAVWNLIDGQRTVREIAELLAERFNGEKNYEYRIALYFAQLYKQGFVK